MIKYCPNCKQNVYVKLVPLTDFFTVRDVEVEATIQTIVCSKCKEEIWDEQNEKNNDNIIFSKYNTIINGGKS